MINGVNAKELVVTNTEALYKTSLRKKSASSFHLDIDIKNQSGADDWYIHIPPPIEAVSLYIKDNEGHLSEISMDESTLHAEKNVRINGFMHPMDLRNDEKKNYLLRIKSSYQFAIPIYIGTMEAIYEEDHFRNIVNGFMFGILAALMIYNLYLFIAIKDSSHLYYLGYVVCSIIFLMTWNEYFTYEMPSWRLRLLSTSSIFILWFSILFANQYLQLAQCAPGLYNLRKWIYPLIVLPFIVDLIGVHAIAFYLLCCVLAIVAAYWFVAGIYSFRRKTKSAVYYLIGVILLLWSYIFYEGFHTSMNIQMGICLQAIVLTFYQATRFNSLKKESIQLKKALMDQTVNFSKRIIIAQEHEKKTIAKELNTSIGQQLVLLKNEIFVLKKRSTDKDSTVFNGITQDIGKAIEEVGLVSSSLHPYQLETLGFKRSILFIVEEVNASSEVNIRVAIDDLDQQLNRETQINLYRIIQELLNNLIKHAHASQCTICIKRTKGNLVFYYHDNGRGFDDQVVSMGLGLVSVHERCMLLRGKANLRSRPTYGTKLLIKIPLYSLDKQLS
ncbi:7TM diverse intracellular signaling domain-containing protein [Sphingobacterium sp. UBA5670]|uniref:7TM diverse intracellular signaling domain-containing protein n=1 Tax=Sphingobacterium sp. UBA5670 TaxID=1947502 RepID=UPI0025DBEDDB|nr:7TM diverse intracellular signaling domain-containing protein [Sphingobacterium sp. UBA5670]